MASNFYVVLGVSRDADSNQIRKAHRRVARMHPVDAGAESLRKFPSIQPNYSTSGQSKYRSSKRKVIRQMVRTGPQSTGAPVAEPTGAVHWIERRSHRGIRLQDFIPGLFDVVDEFMEGWLPGFYTTGPTASRRKDLYVELILTTAEAARGGLFPLAVPVCEKCDACGATGYLGPFFCRNCNGVGVALGRREIEIAMPAGVTDNTQTRLSLEDIGLKGVDLNILVSISG